MSTFTNRFLTACINRLGTRLPKAVLLGLGLWLLVGATAVQAQTPYYWRGAAGANWSAPSSWNTRADGLGDPRTTRLPDDVLIFNGQGPAGRAPEVTMDIDDEISQLQFTGAVVATLTASASGPKTSNSITIDGDATGDPDFTLAAGSRLFVKSGANSTTLNFVLGQNTSVGGPYNATARMDDMVSFAFPTDKFINRLHQFQGIAVGQVEFTSGSSLIITGDKIQRGVPFNLVGLATFDSGATYDQGTGSDPYNLVTFLAGSTYFYKAGGLDAVNTDRVYGNLRLQNTNSITFSGTGSITVQNKLSEELGTVIFKVKDITLLGDLVANGISVQFSPVTTGPTHLVSFAGLQAQTISGIGQLVFSGNVILEINNPAGVTLRRPVAVTTGLRFTAGLLHTTAANLLSLPNTGTVAVAGGNTNVANTSFVDGPMIRSTSRAGIYKLDPGTGTGLFFPIGNALTKNSATGNTTGGYRPIALQLNQNTLGATVYTARVVLGRAPEQDYPASPNLRRVSAVRYYPITSSGASGFTGGQISIYFGPDDEVDAPAKLRIAKSPDSGTVWENLGGTTILTAASSPFLIGNITSFSSTASAGSGETVDVPFTSLGNFVLASTTAIASTGNNPLPVELTRFSAAAQASGIRLDWTTASENNSAAFEVQRSADGNAFETIASVQAQGNSATAHSYSSLDRAALVGLAYYRLRQVDADGTAVYSQVVTARWSGVAGSLQVYPNPSTGTLYVSGVTGQTSYRVLGAQGQVLLTGTTSAEAAMDVQRLAAGLYLLELSTPTGRVVQRFVRQ